ncbi:glycosyltransferase [Gilvimarinus sp. F26214L]|uniref:glycosyltransferase n=1 Tax=Gilvimarinus sp. DZF01 TaxID=3461371 RepID=UPI0040467679
MLDTSGKTILHLIDTTGPGGAETVFVQLADLLRQRGFRSVVVIRGPGWVDQELRRRGLNPIVLDAKGSFAFGFLYRLFRLAKREKVDIVQSHLLGSNVYAALLGILIRRPVVATYHGMVDVNPNERFRRLKNWAMKWGISRYVAVSRSLAAQIRDQGLLDPDKTEIVYNGVDADRYKRKDPGTDDLRARLGLPDNAIVVGSLGNVRPAKAYGVLVEAAALVAKKRKDIYFLVAGHKRSSLMKRLEDLMDARGTGDRVHFLGFFEDSAGFLSQLDYFLLSSRSEGFSIATIEAMMAGLPVLVTRCGGPEEIVSHRHTGRIVEPGDPAALAQGLLEMIECPDETAAMATAGQRHARATFGLDAMLESYIDVYRLTDHHRSSPGIARWNDVS